MCLCELEASLVYLGDINIYIDGLFIKLMTLWNVGEPNSISLIGKKWSSFKRQEGTSDSPPSSIPIQEKGS